MKITLPPRDSSKICRHYLAAAHNDECEAKVVYSDVADELGVKRADVVKVCMGRATGCACYRPYTAAEIEAQEKAQVDQADKIAIARKAIIEKTQGKRNVWGELPCPICKSGTIKYSVAMWNGAIRAKCSTPNCVDWNESK